MIDLKFPGVGGYTTRRGLFVSYRNLWGTQHLLEVMEFERRPREADCAGIVFSATVSVLRYLVLNNRHSRSFSICSVRVFFVRGVSYVRTYKFSTCDRRSRC